ncbi:MAG TPA: GIY-YIG nuclease family protein [Myxococcota bacterium]|nr:GIY-YIG nuclease family protein [Myxococcota bacterium]
MPKTTEKFSCKQKLFIESYLETWNATEAARRAGYKGNAGTLGQVGHENLGKSYIWEEIQHRLSELSKNSGVGAKLAIETLRDTGKKISAGKGRNAGIVYLIQEEYGAVKIGKTISLSRRLATLESQIPYKLTVLLAIESPNMHKVESELHERFSHLRFNGEWFHLSDKDIQSVIEEYGKRTHGKTG